MPSKGRKKNDGARLEALAAGISEVMPGEQGALGRRVAALRRRLGRGLPVDRGIAALERELEVARQALERRARDLPAIGFPSRLPVSRARQEIAEAIQAHQVVVLCGETGSGKTTQLPKICLELGRGVRGLIGHTQPRRIAARSVAARIAAELGTELAQAVGYKIRFTDRTSPSCYVKLMTDGILLAEIPADPELRAYDTIIVDEAHERSLNIDFLLGYLKLLLPRRPDLKLVVTSATIDPERFSIIESGHFGYQGTLTLFDPPDRLDRIELSQVVGPDSAMARWVARRGDSLYMCYVETHDTTDVVSRLNEAGARWTPRGNSRETEKDGLWVHPSALHGLLLGVSRTSLAWEWSGRPEMVSDV